MVITKNPLAHSYSNQWSKINIHISFAFSKSSAKGKWKMVEVDIVEKHYAITSIIPIMIQNSHDHSHYH